MSKQETGWVVRIRRDDNGQTIREAIPVDHNPTLIEMQQWVGGYLEVLAAAGHESPYRPGVHIDVFVDEEGWVAHRPFLALVDTETGIAEPIVGDIVIAASNADGDTIPLARDEVLAITLTPVRGHPEFPDAKLVWFGPTSMAWREQ